MNYWDVERRRHFGARMMRVLFNFYPPYFFTRTRVRSISPDWREVVVELPKSVWTRNYVGTTFGGSMYAACDPFFMFMLIKIMGLRDYIIWDKSAEIDFKKPVNSTLTYRFVITDADLESLHRDLNEKGKSLPVFSVDAVDREGQVCATIKKVVYVRKKAN